jgi:hypothetical protein
MPTSLKPWRAVFAGAVRNTADHLMGVLANLARFSALYKETAFVFGVSDTTDGTCSILGQWLAEGRAGKVIDLGSLIENTPLRTARIAAARNACLAEIQNSGWATYDHLVMCDLDDVLAKPIETQKFADAVKWLEGESTRAGVFANAAPRYYDIWALRHDTWCPCDCWHEIWGRPPSEPFDAAKIREVYYRQIAIPAELPPIRVRSAFGGLGIYRMSYALRARYHGLNDAGRQTADHIAFNADIDRAGGQLFVFPPLFVHAPMEHLYQPVETKLRWRLLMLQRRLDERLRPPWRGLCGEWR